MLEFGHWLILLEIELLAIGESLGDLQLFRQIPDYRCPDEFDTEVSEQQNDFLVVWRFVGIC